jgi:diguanylate cyclase (GGDEF)-like protein
MSYSYRLVGLDQNWLTAGSPPQVSYTGVPPGDYRLEARVRGPGQEWSEPQTLLELSIAPAFWRTSTFRLCVVLAALVGAWGLYRWRLGALARRSLWLEAEVAQRTMDLEAQKAALASSAQALRDANARLYELSTRDALTGVYNRRHALEEVERLIAQADTEARPLVMALIDLDHFKRLNDEYGHLAGDRALAEFGRLLRDSLDSGDMAGRYGGEEFLCVLNQGGLARARAWAETLVQRIAVGGLLWHGRVLQLTVSIGLAEREPGEELLDGWIARADAALYRAKHAGRNRVESAS